MAKLYFKYGAMGSSKSAQVLITKFNYEERGMKVWLIKPATDNRYGTDMITSRIGLSCKADVIEQNDNIRDLYNQHEHCNVIIADECQFFTYQQIDQLRDIVDDENIPVMCFGLRTDFRTKMFEGSMRMFEVADSISEIKTICSCGAKATVNARIDSDGKIQTSGRQIMIGDNDTYVAMCHKCYKNLISQQNNICEKGVNYMYDIKYILSKVDHTLLSQTASLQDILKLCDEGIKFQTSSVCIPACYVKQASDYVKNKVKICTVIGFPNGYDTTKSKCFQAEDAVNNGADEIDMVINIGKLKSGDYDDVLNEIEAVKKSCNGRILKVIIETCLLTDIEKIQACKIVTQSGADFIKTSTGFSSEGAKREDIALFKKHIGQNVKIKAAGGISSLQDAMDFINLGASRLGTSRIVRIVSEDKELNKLF